MELTRAPGDVRARLLVALADLLVVVGNLERQIGYLERALTLYEELGDDERAAQAHSRLGMAHSLIDSIYAEHLDIGRAFRHFDSARPVLARGHVRKARGHLEVGVSSALTYGLQTERGIAAACRAMEIAQQLGDEALWTSAAEACAWHKIVSGELRSGLDRVERAFAAADRGRRSFLAWMASNMAGQLTWGLGDPAAAQAFVERPLHLPYVGETAYRQEVADGVGRCHASRGEMAEARRLLSDAKPAWITHSLKPLLDLWDGEWDAVDTLARRVLETSRRTGNRWDEWASQHLAARVAALRGQHEHAAELLERALAIVVDGGARYFEMWVRPDLARARAETGRLEEARMHVERCREITARGEDWRGRAGHVELADAVVLAFEDRAGEAGARFGEALRILRRFTLRVDEAEALQQWGRALARAGDEPGAAEKLGAASEIYRRHGAGAAWHSRIDAERPLTR
jgi:tetratricopeptide (TPR) repeat protein